jgi:outer membrane protein assembly factor BamB
MHKHFFLISIIFFSFISFAGCGSFGSKDNTEPPAPLLEFTPTLSLKTRWTAHSGGGNKENFLKLVPAFYQNKLFTASPQGKVRAFQVEDGQLIWEQSTKLAISAGPGTGEDLLLIGTHKGLLVALATSDGSEKWRTQLTSEILAVPQISQGVVVARTVDGKLFGLESNNGQQLWIYERNTVPLLSLRGTSSPVIKNDLIIAGFDNGKIAVLTLHQGQSLWEAPISIPRGRTELERMVDIDADPVLMEDTVYVSSYQGRTFAIDATGKPLWKRDVSSYAGMAADFDSLYLSDLKSHVWAFDRYTGASIWKQEKLQARKITAPVVLESYLIVGDKEGYLHWMRKEDGQFVARYQVGRAGIQVAPLVVENTLIALDSQGKIVALQPE